MDRSQSTFRPAAEADLPVLIRLLADDAIGSGRETVDPSDDAAYRTAFEAIDRDPAHELIVLEYEGAVAGMLQLSFLPNLTYTGGLRAQIEGVRIRRDLRGKRLGAKLVRHAVDRAESRGAVLIQLTTDLRRPEAIRFYEGLGFRHSHVGMKLRPDGRPVTGT